MGADSACNHLRCFETCTDTIRHSTDVKAAAKSDLHHQHLWSNASAYFVASGCEDSQGNLSSPGWIFSNSDGMLALPCWSAAEIIRLLDPSSLRSIVKLDWQDANLIVDFLQFSAIHARQQND
jgi:hypothetical protein